MKFRATVVGVMSGKVLLARHDAPKVQTVVATASAEEERELAAMLFDVVEVEVRPAQGRTESGRRSR